jgi:FkbM family methyltransferase
MKNTNVFIRGYLSRYPRLLESVFRLMGKPFWEIAIMRAFVRPGDVCFDVGANSGQYSCLFSKIVGLKGEVHAFEPIPPTFEILKQNIAHNAKGGPVKINNVAIGEKDEKIQLFVSNNKFTEASMIRQDSDSVVPYECNIIAIDNYIKRNCVQHVHFLKCDVEGAELLALKGATNLLRAENPPILFIEAWSGWTSKFGYSPRDLFSFLEEENGYVVYHVCKSGLKRFTPKDEMPPNAYPDLLNFLCINPQYHNDRLGIARRLIVVKN